MNALALRRSFVAVFVLLVATSASAAISFGTASILIDSDRNAATGCAITVGASTYGGIDVVVKTLFDTVGNNMVVTGVTKQQCVAGVLGAPVTIDAGGWNVGKAAGTLYLETHIPVSVLGGLIQPMRYVFAIESGTLSDVVATEGGAPIIFPADRGPGRHRVIVPPSLLNIILDGNIIDWGDRRPLIADAAGTGTPAFRIANIFELAQRGDLFVRLDIQVNAGAPTAQADNYSVISNGVLNQPASSGVLANDINPPGNGSMTAVKLSDPLHGTVTLNADGGFIYANDGSPAVSDSFTYKARNTAGDSNPADVNIAIIQGNAPTITSANATTFRVGVAGNFLVTTSGTPRPSLTRTGNALPNGVTFTDNADGTATLSGTPAAGTGGTYNFLITATNIVSQANQTFTLTVQEAPSITSANTTTLIVGTAGSFTVTANGFPPPTISESGTLPSGVVFNPTTHVLGGTPAAGTAGSYPITFTASNALGSSPAQNFTLIVNCPVTTTSITAPPNVTSGRSYTASVPNHVGSTYNWTASNGSITAGGNSATVTFTAGAAGANGTTAPMSLSVTEVNSLGCSASDSRTMTVYPAPQTVTITVASSTCTGSTGNPASVPANPGMTYSWSISNGTFTTPTTTTNVTFTAGAAGPLMLGLTETNAIGDFASSSATVTVFPRPSQPVITFNPAQICANTTGNQASVPLVLGMTYAWTISGNGTITSGANTDTVTFSAADGGSVTLNVTVTNSDGCSASNSATQPINIPVVVTSNPTPLSVCSGTLVTFSASATGNPTPTVQWQVSTGGPFTDIPGATSTTLSFNATPGESGNRYQAVFTNSCGSVPSSSALLTVSVAPAMTADPTNRTVCAGSSVSFTATASGVPTPSVQWQVSTNGGTSFNDVPGATSTTLTFSPATSDSGNLYHAIFTNSCGTVTSANASLTVNTAPVVTSDPVTQAVCKNTSVSFTATATGSPAPTVQWQLSTDGGATFNDIPGETSTTYTFTAALTDNGHLYRAVFTNSCSPPATTAAATLTVDDNLTITTQPTDTTVCTPNNATFTAAASASGTVRWQVSTDGGTTFNDVPGATSTTYTFTPVLADSGKQYHAVFTNSCGTATTNAATLTVHVPPAVTTQPTSQTVCANTTATFVAAASGTPAPTVQWQQSSGGPFTDIPGATSPTLSFTATTADNGKQYRAVFTNSCSTATTNAATLTVTTVVIAPVAGALTPAIYHAGYSQTFTASGGTTPYTYAISPSTPPAGMSFNTSTGVLSGSAPTLPDNTGNFSFTIAATDNIGCQITQSYTLLIKPGANPDTYSNVVGNTQAWVSGGTTTAPTTPAYTLTGSVLANDPAPAGATASAGPATTNGGNVAMASDGTFLYTPPVGTITNDTFTYTITSNGATNTAQVTIQFANRVWWVKNNAAAGDGRSNTPFNTLSSAGSSSAANDIIFVYAGDGTTTNQNSGITLKNNQLLTGEALALMVNGQTLVAAGATPVIGNSGGAVITVANSDFIQGLNITAVNTAGISVGVGVTGTTSIGTVSITASSSASGVFIAGGSSNLSWTNGGITITAPGSAGAGVNATGGSGTITLTNVPININAGGTGAIGAAAVAIASKSGGGLTLNGGSTVTAGTAGSRQIVSPIQITSSSGTYSFGNKLALWTTGGTATGFLASNSGTLTTTDTASTIDTAGSPAINVQNTTIGASGLTFLNISANGGANGILLNNTGATGHLTVTGTGNTSVGGDSSGGVIQFTSGAGISLTSTSSPSFTNMNIHDTGNSGVDGTLVTNFTFKNSTVNNAGNAGLRSALGFNTNPTTVANLTGTVTVTGNVLTNFFYSGLDVQSGAGAVTDATVSNNIITTSTSALGMGINFVGTGSAASSFSVNNASVATNTINSVVDGVQFSFGTSTTGPGATVGIANDSAHKISITGNSITPLAGGNQAITVSVASSNGLARSTSNFDISNNTPLGSSNIGTVILIGCNGFTTMSGTVTNNNIVATHTPNLGGGNGIAGGNGVAGGSGWTPDLTLTVTGNSISGTDGNGILLVGRGTTHGIFRLKIANNTVGTPVNVGGTARQGIRVDAGNAASVDDEVYLNISGNTSVGSNGAAGIGVRKQGAIQTTNDFGIFDAPGGNTLANCPNPTNTDVQNFINAQNPLGNGTNIISGSNYECDSTQAPP